MRAAGRQMLGDHRLGRPGTYQRRDALIDGRVAPTLPIAARGGLRGRRG